MKKQSYYETRIVNELGITEEQNSITVINTEGNKIKHNIFSEDKNGNIKILIYRLNREIIEYDHPKATLEKPNIYNNRILTYYITRLHPENVKGNLKYLIPKGQGTFPFIPPTLLNKYEDKVKIKTLVLTEGAFKAFKGDMHGLDIIGLSSITHYKDKKTAGLHPDIIELIKTCEVENVIMLYDGDCLDISQKALKEGEDLYKRPSGFFSSAVNINDLLKDYDISFYFAHIRSSELTENPKGLDDLLITFKGKETEIIKDLLSYKNSGNYFHKMNMSGSPSKLKRYMHINKADTFYNYHIDLILDNEFIFKGNMFKYNEYDDKLELLMPAEAKNYFRVGDDYYVVFNRPNKHGALESIVSPILKSTIIDDHGRKILKSILKYKAFVNVPDHKNYKNIIHDCYNSYSPFTHIPQRGKCNKTLDFLKHIFEEQYELGLDYIQIMYQNPVQKLPILCLVSKENSTGKSTFPKWLQKLFTQNVTIIGNAEIASEFNSHLASKLVIAIDEGFIEKKIIVEKIKYMATADTMSMNRKGKDIVDVDFFAKIIILSNNVDNFITANAEDIRYWVRELKVIDKENIEILSQMEKEIPAFLYYLDNRNLSTIKESRSWFHPDTIRTKAFQRVVEASKPSIVREIETNIKEKFFECETDLLMLALKDIKELFFDKSYNINRDYISRTLKDHFPHVERAKTKNGKEGTVRYKIPIMQEVSNFDGDVEIQKSFKHASGRPFIFRAEDFLNDNDLQSLKSSYK